MTAQDLTAITTPYGLLDAETRAALRANGGPIEVYINTREWVRLLHPAWDNVRTYRVRPATKPSIDWSHVAEGINWLSVGSDGEAYLFRDKPQISMDMHSGFWSDANGYPFDVSAHASYTPGTCDWKDSLVCRPGYEGDAA